MKIETDVPEHSAEASEKMLHENQHEMVILERQLSKIQEQMADLQTEKMFAMLDRDSLREVLKRTTIPHIETIDIDIDRNENSPQPLINIVPRDPDTDISGSEEKIIFRIPDFSVPDKPKLIRYNYHSAEFEDALEASFKRNILITVILFGFSILAILFISRKFLKPIGVLQQSFDQVINGNLEVTAAVKSRDEMAYLTGAFNHMVGELRKNREKEKLLQQKERLASMGQLAAGIAHEIKNPLNAINLTIDHLRDKFAKKDRTAQKYIRTIQSEITRLDSIVDNFLNFLRSEYLKKTKTNLNELIENVRSLLETEIRSAGIITEIISDKPFITRVDPERFKTVLLNILLNAIHALPQGGKIRIFITPEENKICIEDNGIGIPPDNIEKIFDIFYTTKSKGTGLGLPTAYKIVKEHGGDISIESEEGKGTRVSIHL
ncbi:MAG: HAMP domain-containing protein [bacterium]|nr:MAG: HAMP domain-containing protein [bacterium]